MKSYLYPDEKKLKEHIARSLLTTPTSNKEMIEFIYLRAVNFYNSVFLPYSGHACDKLQQDTAAFQRYIANPLSASHVCFDINNSNDVTV